MKFKKSDDHTNIDKYRVLAIITEYYIKINLLWNHYSKLMKIRQLFHVKNVSKMSKN